VRLRAFFERALRSTAELPLAALLKEVGVKVNLGCADSPAVGGGNEAQRKQTQQTPRAVLGVKTEAVGADLKLAQVFDAGAAAAVSPEIP
jgi:predicted metalloprotease with PDZ domain